MDIAMTLPTMVAHDRADTLAWCRSVDEGPWSSLAIPERITYPAHNWVVEASAAAALTERVRLWTTIIVLPAHDAVDVAKQTASIDVLSAGRLTVGVGVGGREHDYRAINGSFERRWARMDEQVATMRRIWAGEPPVRGRRPGRPSPGAGRRPADRRRGDGPEGAGPRLEVGRRRRRRRHRLRHRPGRRGGRRSTGSRQAWADAGRTERPAPVGEPLVRPRRRRRRAPARLRLLVHEDLRRRPRLGHGRRCSPCRRPRRWPRRSATLDELGCDELFLVPTTADVDRARPHPRGARHLTGVGWCPAGTSGRGSGGRGPG